MAMYGLYDRDGKRVVGSYFHSEQEANAHKEHHETRLKQKLFVRLEPTALQKQQMKEKEQAAEPVEPTAKGVINEETPAGDFTMPDPASDDEMVELRAPHMELFKALQKQVKRIESQVFGLAELIDKVSDNLSELRMRVDALEA